MSESLLPGRPAWASGPLYRKICDVFPDYRTELGVLDIQRLKGGLKKSHEAIYKWFRLGKITPDNARAIVSLATGAESADIGIDNPLFRELAAFF